ncbi:RNA polymerase sigma factor [Opitutus sp. ER46]|uniref:RNA polymerase sigma factor n=1 Tax=Opitutus sp. ER46 TaxID=2161864 RepID=UPI0013048172|nr:RNA polymerase sigma factor [Opitutus sp. ER46]
MPPTDADQSQWFTVEVQPHEAALRSYLQARFPALRDFDDVVQETYRRVLHEHAAGRLRHARAFMFTAARNVALDLFRRRAQENGTPIPQASGLDVVEERPDAAQELSQRQELQILADAIAALPDRCRHVIMLRYLKSCSYQEIADTLGVSTETVKTHMAKGVQRCAEYFEARGILHERARLHLKLD